MSSGWESLDDYARKGDLDGIKRCLGKRDISQSDINFGFQAACEEGQAGAAKALLRDCHIISVSRGMRAACWKPSHACMLVALERLDAEDALDRFDIALAFRDSKLWSLDGIACAKELFHRAKPAESAWALRELMAQKSWSKARALLEAGAGWEAVPEFNMVSGDIDYACRIKAKKLAEPSPRAYWEAMPKDGAGEALERSLSGLALSYSERKLLEKQQFAGSAEKASRREAMEGFPDLASKARFRI